MISACVSAHAVPATNAISWGDKSVNTRERDRGSQRECIFMCLTICLSLFINKFFAY